MFPGLEYIPQVPGNQAEVSQNHDLRKTDSATLTLKKKWGYISAQKLEGESSQRFPLSVLMQSNAIRSWFGVPGTGKYPLSSGIAMRSSSKSRCAKRDLGYGFSHKGNWGYISAQKLESDRLKSYALCI